MKVAISVLLILTAFSPFVLGQELQTDKEQAAVTAARIWLNLVDQGKYSESRSVSAQYFKTAVSEKQWQETVTAVRVPLGKVVSRKLLSTQYATSLPGAPDGEYVVIQYETSFENKKSAVETVTPMLDKNGGWKVAGYYTNNLSLTE